MNFVPIQRHFGFQTQGVSSTEAARLYAKLHSGVEDLTPDPLGLLGCNVDLEAIFPRIAGARNPGRRTRHRAVDEMIILDRSQVDFRQFL